VTSRPPPPTPPDLRIAYPAVRLVTTDPDKTIGLLGPWRTKRYRHFSICCTVPVRICSLTATTIYPDHSAGDRSGLHQGESSPRCGARFLRLLCLLLTSATRWSPLTVRSVLWTRSRSPGVNTYLSAHERRVYAFGLRWIEDFALCCRLVPPKPPKLGSCTSPRAFAVPCRGRAASSPGTIAGYPVAIPLYPSPPSGWVWDLLNF